MTEEQKDRFAIYKECGNNAQKAYDFIFKTTHSNETHLVKDGVYIIYKNGNYELFNKENKKDDVYKIGLIMGEKKIAIGLQDKGGYHLIKDEDEEEYRYYDDTLNAFSDWSGDLNTGHIKRVRTDIPLDEGEFIPALGQLGFINLFLKLVNKALKYVGGEELKGYHWSSTQGAPMNAWMLDLGDGYVSHGDPQTCSINVRAVSSFLL